jgi:hypothetical protein
MAEILTLKSRAQTEGLSRRRAIGWSLAIGLLFIGLNFLPSLYAQGPGREVIYSRQPRFRIPFDTDPGERRLQQVQLYFSTNQGQTWQSGGTVSPAQRGFDFQADRDGLYWFAVQTIDFQNQANPPTVQGLRPQLKVFVDTQPPLVTLRQGVAEAGSVNVEWDIRDDNLDLSSFSLEYRLPGGNTWVPLTVAPAVTGQRSWNPGANGAVEVRLRVRDLAKNEGESTLTIVPVGGQNAAPSATRTVSQPQPAVSYVNSKTIKLNYDIAEKGPSGISAIELWFTRDGQTWARLDEKTGNLEPPLVHTLQDEGLYGFIILPRSGVGFKGPEPRTGDPPQLWVEVDVTKPEISWINVDVGRGQDLGKVFITWKATDKNLGRDPVKLSYAENTAGPWTPIGPGPLENTGRFEWLPPPPPATPVKFFVRIEVTDKAGNVATRDKTDPTVIDLKIPKAILKSADPAARP